MEADKAILWGTKTSIFDPLEPERGYRLTLVREEVVADVEELDELREHEDLLVRMLDLDAFQVF